MIEKRSVTIWARVTPAEAESIERRRGKLTKGAYIRSCLRDLSSITDIEEMEKRLFQQGRTKAMAEREAVLRVAENIAALDG